MSKKKSCEALSLGKNMSRAQRRHERETLKKARRVYWGHRGQGLVWSDPMTERQLGMIVATPAICSCAGCGNPRNHLGNDKDRLSRQELAHTQRRLHEED